MGGHRGTRQRQTLRLAPRPPTTKPPRPDEDQHHARPAYHRRATPSCSREHLRPQPPGLRRRKRTALHFPRLLRNPGNRPRRLMGKRLGNLRRRVFPRGFRNPRRVACRVCQDPHHGENHSPRRRIPERPATPADYPLAPGQFVRWETTETPIPEDADDAEKWEAVWNNALFQEAFGTRPNGPRDKDRDPLQHGFYAKDLNGEALDQLTAELAAELELTVTVEAH